MKKFTLALAVMVISMGAMAQGPASAKTGVTYGAGTTKEGAVSVNDVEKKVVDNKFEGKITGKVAEVCQEKGCWMKIEKSDGSTMMVKFKDYAFFMPKDIVGKEVVLEGTASVKEVSVKQQKHYAEDAGKSQAEIDAIKEPKKEMTFVAAGVLVL